MAQNFDPLAFLRALTALPGGQIPSEAAPILNAPANLLNGAFDKVGIDQDLFKTYRDRQDPGSPLFQQDPMGLTAAWLARQMGVGLVDTPKSLADSSYKIVQGKDQGPMDYVNLAGALANFIPGGEALGKLAPGLEKSGMLGLLREAAPAEKVLGELSDAAPEVGAAVKAGPAWLEGHPNLKSFKEANPDRLVFHGTPSDFESFDPTKYDMQGSAGPGFYSSYHPEYSDEYAFGLNRPEGYTEESTPNLRPMILSKDFKVFDKLGDAAPEDIKSLEDALTTITGKDQTGRVSAPPGFEDQPDFSTRWGNRPTSAEEVLRRLQVFFRNEGMGLPERKLAVADTLERAGFHGIRHRDAMRLENVPWSKQHSLAILPHSLGKLNNALTGAPGGQVDARLAAGLGGGAGIALLLQQLLGLGGPGGQERQSP